MKTVQTLWKTIWQFLKYLNMHLLYNLAIPFLDIYSKEKKKHLSTVRVYANIHSILICNSQKLEMT